MEREVLFERLYQLLEDTAHTLIPQPEVNIVESLFYGDLLSKWRELCLELSGHTLEEFREWAHHKGGT